MIKPKVRQISCSTANSAAIYDGWRGLPISKTVNAGTYVASAFRTELAATETRVVAPAEGLLCTWAIRLKTLAKMMARLEERPNHCLVNDGPGRQTHIIMRAIMGIISRSTVGGHKVEIEECLAPLHQTAIPVDHGECSEAEGADADATAKVYIWARTICVG